MAPDRAAPDRAPGGESAAPQAPGGRAAGVVLFGPDRARLTALLAAISGDVDRIYLFINGRIAPDLRDDLPGLAPAVEVIDAPVNFGVATALNLLVLAAGLAGYETICLFDQDSRPAPGMVTRLAETREALARSGAFPAVVGPKMVAPAGEGYKAPRVFARSGVVSLAGAVAVDFLATSGSLLDIGAFLRIGAFRDDYFIDAVDLEWGFRAWAAGFSIWLDPGAPMPHTVGDGTIVAGRLVTPRQKLFRMATYVRNNVYGLRLRHISRGFRARQALYIPAQCLAYWRAEGYDRAVARRLLRAFADGARGRLGPPDDAPEN